MLVKTGSKILGISPSFLFFWAILNQTAAIVLATGSRIWESPLLQQS
jgi:hypothetical protein